MAEPLRTCEFALIRIYPDPIRKEFLNIGVCLFEPSGAFAEVRVLDDFRRLHCLFPAFETSVLSGLEADLRSVLRRRQRAFDPEQLFYLAGETFAQSLELSPRHGLLTADPVHSLNDLFERFVATPPAVPGQARPLTIRRQVVAALREAFTASGVLARLGQRVRAAELAGGADPYRFDFHYRPNGVHNLIQALDLGHTRGVKELSFTVSGLRDRLRAQGRGLAVIAVYPQADDDTQLGISLRVAPPLLGADRPAESRSAAAGFGLDRYHRQILEQARIGLHPVSAAAELAAHVRADLKL